jgi:hypothetical protein
MFMTNPSINNATASPNDDREIALRGQIFYENEIRSQVETPDNIGKIISIDILMPLFGQNELDLMLFMQ